MLVHDTTTLTAMTDTPTHAQQKPTTRAKDLAVGEKRSKHFLCSALQFFWLYRWPPLLQT